VTRRPSHNSDAGGDGSRTSLDRLADLARRVLAVPKEEIPMHKPKRRKKKRGGKK